MTIINVGVIGCGNISDAYFKAAPQFDVLKMVAVADINMDAASAKAETYGLKALSVAELLAADDIDIVLNLTTPQYHVEVGLQVIAAGKHVYSEKPLALNLAEATELANAAKAKGLRVGCAPDTFLGGAHQTARKVIDDGLIGDVVAGTAFMMCPGHERWHPNPDFYYQAGGGPMLDMGPYYITALINMLGPVDAVVGMAKATYNERAIKSGDREGESFGVKIDTHFSGIMQFASGATVTMTQSFDVHKHEHSPIEIYGQKGSMLVADPNKFEGEIKISAGLDDWEMVEQSHIYGDGDYRILGLADMAQAIVSDRPHRAGLELSLHVLEVMQAIQTAADEERIVKLEHQCGRPAALSDAIEFGKIGD
ncbi:MAG: oxidoreductase [Hyphomicrobiales bacterium]|nr:MAG: oxidoreductase [Hyphomicrobiales bacterium]